MQIIKKVIKVGNSAGVLLPKQWYGGEARVELIKKPLNVKEDVIRILNPYLQSILGIYLVGSYSRNEQTNGSDIDIIAISEDITKEIVQKDYHISIYPLSDIERTIKEHPILILPRLLEAVPIINKTLLYNLKRSETNLKSISEFIKETLGIINLNKSLIKLNKSNITQNEVIYSLMLRLRGIFMAKNTLKKQISFNKEFKKLLGQQLSKKEIEDSYEIYRALRDDKPIKKNVSYITEEKLINILEKETLKLKSEIKNDK